MTTAIDDSNELLIFGCPANTDPADNWGTYGDSNANNGSYHYAYGALCSMEFSFSGRAVRVIGISSFQTGVFSCTIDNGTTFWFNSWKPNVNLYNQTTCFYDGLTSGNHTIRMTTAPLAGRQLIIDEILVTPAGFGSTLTVSSNSTPYTLPSLIVAQNVTSTPEPSQCNSTVVVGLAAGLGTLCLILLITTIFVARLRPKKAD